MCDCYLSINKINSDVLFLIPDEFKEIIEANPSTITVREVYDIVKFATKHQSLEGYFASANFLSRALSSIQNSYVRKGICNDCKKTII